MIRKPPIDEIQFIKLTQNHGEFRRKLEMLGHGATSDDLCENAHYVGLCWLQLASDHMRDARAAIDSSSARAAYSRSYYAAYNASKSVRYIVNGSVSLRADDHQRAGSDLPTDFPDLEKWAETITKLYEHRLRADYDNWSTTASEHSLSVVEVVALADQFLTEAKQYLQAKCGVVL